MNETFPGLEDMTESVEDEALMPICGVRICKFIDSDGDEQIRYRFDGDPSPTEILGLIDFVSKLAFWSLMVSSRGGDTDAP